MPDETELETVNYTPTESESGFLNTGSGVLFRPESVRNEMLLAYETHSFAKWLRLNRPDIPVELEKAETLALHSGDFWMPFAVLGSDVAVHFYIDLVAHYVYDRIKGALGHDKHTVHLSVICTNSAGDAKQIIYNGPVEGLKETFDKVNLNDFVKDD